MTLSAYCSFCKTHTHTHARTHTEREGERERERERRDKRVRSATFTAYRDNRRRTGVNARRDNAANNSGVPPPAFLHLTRVTRSLCSKVKYAGAGRQAEEGNKEKP